MNCWKIIAFYVAQNHALICQDIEIYSKQGLIDYAPEFFPFIYRQELTFEHKQFLQNYLQEWLDRILDFGSFESKDGWLICGDEKIDMKNEKYQEVGAAMWRGEERSDEDAFLKGRS